MINQFKEGDKVIYEGAYEGDVFTVISFVGDNVYIKPEVGNSFWTLSYYLSIDVQWQRDEKINRLLNESRT